MAVKGRGEGASLPAHTWGKLDVRGFGLEIFDISLWIVA